MPRPRRASTRTECPCQPDAAVTPPHAGRAALARRRSGKSGTGAPTSRRLTPPAGTEGGTLDGAIERAIAYVREATVDLIWMNGMNTREEIRAACRRIPAPVMVSYYGEPPIPSLDQWRELAVAAVIFPAIAASVAAQATWDFLHEWKARGSVAMDDWRAARSSGRWGAVDMDALVSTAYVRELEARYLPADLQRDYDRTFGHR